MVQIWQERKEKKKKKCSWTNALGLIKKPINFVLNKSNNLLDSISCKILVETQFKLGVSNGWVWVGIKWVGPLKPNSPFKPI